MKHIIREIPNEQFDAKLTQILDGMTGAQLLSIPGVYEVVAEELNNDVIEAIEHNTGKMHVAICQDGNGKWHILRRTSEDALQFDQDVTAYCEQHNTHYICGYEPEDIITDKEI